MTTAATPTGSTPRRLNWDVIRVVAVASVVVQHATYTVEGVLPWLRPTPFTWSIQAGANTLMVVSAYFVCVTLAKGGGRGHWWWHRMARLLPAYIVAVLVTYGLTLYAAQYGYWRPGTRDLVGNLLLIQGWDAQVTYIDHSYWTLPAQLTMFTIAACAAAWVGRSFWRRPTPLPVVAWLVVALPLLVLWLSNPGDPARTVFDGLVMYRWQVFGIGLAVWLWARGRMSLPHLGLLVAAGLGAEYVQTPDLASVLVLGLAVIGVAAAAGGPDWTWLQIGPLPRVIRWLAGLSFGIYLVNQQIGYFLAWALEARFDLDGWPRLALVVVTAVVLGWGLTKAVERPVHRLLTRRRSGDTDTGRQQRYSADTDPQRGNEEAAARNRSFSSGEEVVTRTPSPANARTTTLFSSVCSANSSAREPSGSQTKLASEAGTS